MHVTTWACQVSSRGHRYHTCKVSRQRRKMSADTSSNSSKLLRVEWKQHWLTVSQQSGTCSGSGHGGSLRVHPLWTMNGNSFSPTDYWDIWCFLWVSFISGTLIHWFIITNKTDQLLLKLEWVGTKRASIINQRLWHHVVMWDGSHRNAPSRLSHADQVSSPQPDSVSADNLHLKSRRAARRLSELVERLGSSHRGIQTHPRLLHTAGAFGACVSFLRPEVWQQ